MRARRGRGFSWLREALGGATGAGVVVAVVDSGWDRGNTDPRVLHGVSFVDPRDDLATAGPNEDFGDRIGHGTSCADLVLAAAPGSSILPIRVFGSRLETSVGTMLAGLEYAVEADCQVVSMSLGTWLEEAVAPLHAICDRAASAGRIVVAAAGHGPLWTYPSVLESVLGVAASESVSLESYRYVRGGDVEVEGSGQPTPVLELAGVKRVRKGSSYVAPIIAGVVAVILERYPRAGLRGVRGHLELLSRHPERGVP